MARMRRGHASSTEFSGLPLTGERQARFRGLSTLCAPSVFTSAVILMSYVARSDRPADKAARYAEVEAEILAVLDGEPDRVARMATVSSMLADAFEDYLWTGFYVVDSTKLRELVVGPYQGTLGCLRIPFGKGVCGAAAETGRTQVVEDVHAFPGHIACDGRSESEIVVPVFDRQGELVAVFDVDATRKAAFDVVDAEALEGLMKKVFAA
jgi:L-methionine (R)-S-oxide reductase